MLLSYYQVDAFAERLFEGNPAGVCLLDDWLDVSLMQSIATENNLSETAFVVKQHGTYSIRWFTPRDEVDLCGHATLASAHVIMSNSAEKQITFQTQSRGALVVTRINDGGYQMSFPVLDVEQIADPAESLVSLFDIRPKAIYRGLDYLAVFENEAQIRSLTINESMALGLDRRGIIVTAPGDAVDCVSRCFYPKLDVPEDPVTGSAHCMIAPFWASNLGVSHVVADQLSRRGGRLYCEVAEGRVFLSGKAVTYFEGRISVPVPIVA